MRIPTFKIAALAPILLLLAGVGRAQDLDLILSSFRSDIDPDATGQTFGTHMAADGIWAVVSGTDTTIPDGTLGAVYLYRFDNGWVFEKRLETPPEPDTPRRVGWDVAIDGEWIAVSIQNTGVALYRRDQGGPENWGFHSRVVEDDNTQFRERDASLTVALDGDTLIVGAPLTDYGPFTADTNQVGSVLVYGLVGNDWQLSQLITIPAADQERIAGFGGSVKVLGNLLAVGSPTYSFAGLGSPGQVWVYQRNTATSDFTLFDTLRSDAPVDNGRFGVSLGLSATTLAVGSPNGAGDLTPLATNDGSIYIFEPSLTGYDLMDELVPSTPEFLNGFAADLAIEGDLLWSADEAAGFLFRRSTQGQWAEIDRNSAPDFPPPQTVRQFGTSVAFTREGTRLHGIVGDRIAELLLPDPNNPGMDRLTRVGAAFFYLFDDGLFADSFED
ncbi:MAG: hypothetical protein AAF358_16360 [Pseudomonadota bacterium]